MTTRPPSFVLINYAL